jgi:hypothetical protein
LNGGINIARVINYYDTFVQFLGAVDKTGVCVRCIKLESLNIEIEESLDKTSIKFYPNPTNVNRQQKEESRT